MFVEGQHLASHLTAVIQSYSHTIVDQILLVHEISLLLWWNKPARKAYHFPLFVRHVDGILCRVCDRLLSKDLR